MKKNRGKGYTKTDIAKSLGIEVTARQLKSITTLSAIKVTKKSMLIGRRRARNKVNVYRYFKGD